MSVEGLEPPTNGLKGHCSTIELHARLRVGFYHAPFIKSTGEEEHCAFRRRTGRVATLLTEDRGRMTEW